MIGLTAEQLEALFLYDRITRVPSILDHGSPNPALSIGEAAQVGRDFIALQEVRMGVYR